MWTFRGEYTGEARAYIQQKKKKEAKIWAITFSIISIIANVIMAFLLSADDIKFASIIFVSGTLCMLSLVYLVLFIDYRGAPKCQIRIENDGFEVYVSGKWCPLAFYKIEEITEYDDFIAVENISRFKVALQKDLLVEGDWEELKVLLKKVEDSLETDDPLYQIEEPITEYWEATVKSKRIYERFVNGVSWTTPVGVFQYFATFQLENEEEVEYEIGQEFYEKIEEGQTGTLVVTNGNFFAFGEGEEVDE